MPPCTRPSAADAIASWPSVIEAGAALSPGQSPSRLEAVLTALTAICLEAMPGGADADARLDTDRVCLDCLALAGLVIIFMGLAVLFSNRRRCQVLPSLNREPVPLDFSPPYPARGPPRL